MNLPSILAGLLLLTSLCNSSTLAQDQLICCGGDEVFILRIQVDSTISAKPVWKWKAADSPEIPQAARKTFASTDDCKPIGEFILITSSSGGVAIVGRSDKRCHFYTQAKNAHSACLLPDYRVAVASSFGGDELRIYNLEKPKDGAAAKPVTRIPLRGAHGTVWDKKRNRLWALGTDELLLVDVRGAKADTTLAVEQRIKLPTPGGHELSQSRDEPVLFVTTNQHAYRFSKEKHTFTPDPTLADQPKVKSISQHPKTGELVYHQGTAKTWWSDTIRFVGKRQAVRLPNRRLYKIRWDITKPGERSQ